MRLITKFGLGSLCLLLGVIPNESDAHHSAARFSQDEIVVVDGTVINYQWQMPHVYLSVEDRQGRAWQIETDGPPILVRSGWSSDTFTVGDAVSARVHPSRAAGDLHVLLVSIQAENGDILDSFNRAGRDTELTEAGATSLAGVWTSSRSQIFSFLQSWQSHALTAKGREALAAYDASLAASTECLAWPTPFLMTSNYWYLNEVTLTEDKMVIRSEFYDSQRTIWMNRREHSEGAPRTLQGDSVGWWEGDTLVVDTTGFADNRSPIAQIGIPSGAAKHVIERLTLGDDGSTMLIDVYMEDPEFLAEPLSTQFTWAYSPHLELISAPCNAENARRFLE
jgi:hypothetical protein